MVQRNEIKELPELLCPAGSFENVQTALLYGADAVYLAGESYGLRAKAKNLNDEELAEAVRLAHGLGKKVYVTFNIVARETDFEGLSERVHQLKNFDVDALIVSDAGLFSEIRRIEPELPLHLSTQASATNSATFRFWAGQGAQRIVCARELSLEEIRSIREHTPAELELEAFVHGAMCMSISGRCLISNFMTGQSANLGACTQPCRWNYALMEESRPGEYFPVEEDERGTYFFNSKDLCMVEYIPELIEAGIVSFKIEGRMKTPLYVAMTTKIYREALDDYARDPALYETKKAYYRAQLERISHRGYTTGFYFGRPGAEAQTYDSSSYQKSLEMAAKILEIREDGTLWVEQRGPFFKGESLVLLNTKGEPEELAVSEIINEKGEAIEKAAHAQEHVCVRITDYDCSGMVPGLILSRKI